MLVVMAHEHALDVSSGMFDITKQKLPKGDLENIYAKIDRKKSYKVRLGNRWIMTVCRASKAKVVMDTVIADLNRRRHYAILEVQLEKMRERALKADPKETMDAVLHEMMSIAYEDLSPVTPTTNAVTAHTPSKKPEVTKKTNNTDASFS